VLVDLLECIFDGCFEFLELGLSADLTALVLVQLLDHLAKQIIQVRLQLAVVFLATIKGFLLEDATLRACKQLVDRGSNSGMVDRLRDVLLWYKVTAPVVRRAIEELQGILGGDGHANAVAGEFACEDVIKGW